MKNIKLNFVFLCDYASMGEAGKLNIMGIFKTIFGKQLPIVQPQMFIVTNVSVDKGRDYKEVIKITDEDDQEIGKAIEFKFSFPKDEKDEKVEAGFIGQLNATEFNKEGKHKLKIYINDELIESMPFGVKVL